MSHKITIGNRTVKLPKSKALRIALGIGLVIGGILGFLPIVGFWMFPLGVIVLSFDMPAFRRFRRRMQVWLGRRIKAKNESKR